MQFNYPNGIAHPPIFLDEYHAYLADNLIAQEVARERGILKYRLRQAGVPFHPEMETNDLVTLMGLCPSH
jgi:hypothetical protein